jgi:hypothetical protein
LRQNQRSTTDFVLAGREILIPPDSPSDGVRVAFILENGAPIELLEFTDPNHLGRRQQQDADANSSLHPKHIGKRRRALVTLSKIARKIIPAFPPLVLFIYCARFSCH